MKEHEYFKREDQNIVSFVSLSLTEAVLGCKITVDTIDGKINIVVPPGTSENDMFTLKNLGVHPFNPPDNYDEKELRGDHIIKFKVVLP